MDLTSKDTGGPDLRGDFQSVPPHYHAAAKSIGYVYSSDPASSAKKAAGNTAQRPKVQPEPIKRDWQAYLANWGFPKQVVTELNSIFTKYPDSEAAKGAALAYVRGTDWYKATFPGINEGIRKGLIGDERDYRAYVNQATQLYKSYLGRDVTTGEVAAALKAGNSVQQIGGKLGGAAWVSANRQDVQQEAGAFGGTGHGLSNEQLKALGEQNAGLSSTMGVQLEAKLAKVKQRMATIFEGTLATPSMSLATGRLSAPSLLAGKTNSDYGA